jgi:hypothetical protein
MAGLTSGPFFIVPSRHIVTVCLMVGAITEIEPIGVHVDIELPVGMGPTSPHVSSDNTMTAPGSLFRCGFAIESIAQANDD